MTSVAALPFGQVPSLREFKRQVWQYRDTCGATALSPPPEIFTYVADDSNDKRVVTHVASTLRHLGFAERVGIQHTNTVTLISFRDIEALHAFLKLLAANPMFDPAADTVATFVMELLGFSWTR